MRLMRVVVTVLLRIQQCRGRYTCVRRTLGCVNSEFYLYALSCTRVPEVVEKMIVPTFAIGCMRHTNS